MASPQPQLSPLSLLSDSTVQTILSYAMTRDSPFYISNPYLPLSLHNPPRKHNVALTTLHSSTGSTDPLFLHTKNNCHPIHLHDSQSTHLTDWIFINSTSRRIRLLGKPCFFKAKVFAMHSNVPFLLQQGEFTRLSIQDQKIALSHIHDIVIVNAKEASPNRILQLPKTLAVFPSLRCCTLLFGFSAIEGGEDDAEWIAVAFALRSQVKEEMRSLMGGIGLRSDLRLEEAMGPGWTWEVHWENIEKWVYPMLGVKGMLMRGREEEKKRENLQRKREEEMKSSKPRFWDSPLMSKL